VIILDTPPGSPVGVAARGGPDPPSDSSLPPFWCASPPPRRDTVANETAAYIPNHLLPF
jgi:hypothetical protein